MFSDSNLEGLRIVDANTTDLVTIRACYKDFATFCIAVLAQLELTTSIERILSTSSSINGDTSYITRATSPGFSCVAAARLAGSIAVVIKGRHQMNVGNHRAKANRIRQGVGAGDEKAQEGT